MYRKHSIMPNEIRHFNPTGSRIQPKYGWRYDEDGNMVYKIVGKKNVYEEIQANRDSVDIQAILKRYENGDDTALDRVQNMFYSEAGMPKNYYELFNAVENCKFVFNSMPIEIKEKFDNSAMKFWMQSGSPEFDEALNSYRREVYAAYGKEDPAPIKTVVESVVEPLPFKEPEVVEKGVITDVPKSE